jgi:hypothetical protein
MRRATLIQSAVLALATSILVTALPLAIQATPVSDAPAVEDGAENRIDIRLCRPRHCFFVVRIERHESPTVTTELALFGDGDHISA